MPLRRTEIGVRIDGGLATVRTTRWFANAEAVPIEAILTFPVGFDAVVTGLSIEIDGRSLTATAAPKAAARKTYEDAIDRGKLAVLHDEVLRGVHMVSVAQLLPGKEVRVDLDCVMPLALAGQDGLLRLPQTVGQLYGASPQMPADDLVTGLRLEHVAALTLVHADRPATLADGSFLLPGVPTTIALDHALELRVPVTVFGTVTGWRPTAGPLN